MLAQGVIAVIKYCSRPILPSLGYPRLLIKPWDKSHVACPKCNGRQPHAKQIHHFLISSGSPPPYFRKSKIFKNIYYLPIVKVDRKGLKVTLANIDVIEEHTHILITDNHEETMTLYNKQQQDSI